MYSPEIALLDGGQRHFRAAVLKSRGFRVFTTEHVVEVCLRWVVGNCAALVIGPEVDLHHVATLCDWIKINGPERPIIVIRDRPLVRCPVQVDAVVATQPVQAVVERLRALLPENAQVCVPVERSQAAARASLRLNSRVPRS